MSRVRVTAFSTLQLAPFLLRMTVFLGLAGLAVAFILPTVIKAFLENPFLNGLILAVLVVGILNAYRLVWQLLPDIAWVANLRRTDPSMSPVTSNQPRLLGPLANMLQDSRGRLRLTAPVARSILDGVQSRLDESRDIARYMTGLLVFLGLLGTFWGLILVVDSVAMAIRSMGGDGAAVSFDQLRAGLEGPLSGMGTAFSSSLFGLAGSLVLGFLDLQSGQAQNRFYIALEEWMSTVTRLGSGPSALAEGAESGSTPAYVTALLEQTAENLENLERTLVRLEERRVGGGAESSANMELAAAMRSIDTSLRGLIQEQAAGRDAFVQELRQEVKLLGRTLAAMGDRQKA